MTSDETPVHLGTLETTGVVETPDGDALLLETGQGEFLLTIDDLGPAHALLGSVEHYRKDVVRDSTDAE